MTKQGYFDTIVFDLDGTLLNSLEDLAQSTNYALQAFGFPMRSIDEIRRFIGNGGRRLITRALPEGISDEISEQVFHTFSAHYADHMTDHTKPYPGIVALLQACNEQGIKLAVVSNKMDDAVVPLVRLWFGRWIKVAVGEGNGIPKKPSPQGVQKALAMLESEPSSAIYLGDSDVDVATAINAKAFPVGCTWGFRDRSVLEAAGAKAIIDRPDELLSLL